jgi:hypothetical protein
LSASKRIAAHKRVKNVLKSAKSAEIETAESTRAPVGECVVSELIVLLAFIGIAQDAVGLAQLLELRLGFLVVLVDVGVILLGERAVRLLSSASVAFRPTPSIS